MPHLAIVPRVLTAALLAFTSYPVAAEPLPAGFVRLRELAPAIAQDIRYATPFNFTGAPAPGYGRGECVLTRAAAAWVSRASRRARAWRVAASPCSEAGIYRAKKEPATPPRSIFGKSTCAGAGLSFE